MTAILRREALYQPGQHAQLAEFLSGDGLTVLELAIELEQPAHHVERILSQLPYHGWEVWVSTPGGRYRAAQRMGG